MTNIKGLLKSNLPTKRQLYAIGLLWLAWVGFLVALGLNHRSMPWWSLLVYAVVCFVVSVATGWKNARKE